jgi:DNA invertase Pin-like site-specific DNA recombinase
MGALSRFLQGVDTGEVIAGDFLLVEDMDRMTREPVSDALKLVIGILEAQITICVLNSGWEITLESFNRDPSHVFMLAAVISRANAESRRKSEMLTTAAASRRARAREHGVPFTTQGPPWTDYVDGGFVLNDKVQIVRRVFEWAAAGMGSYSITRRLKDTPSLTGRGRWRDGTVTKLLHNRSVLGWYQPCRRPKDEREIPDGEPIKLYPEAIDAALFQKVQDAIRPRIGEPLRGSGRIGFAIPNLFQKLAHCAHCGWPMHLKPVQPHGGKRRDYLYCSGKAGHLCNVLHNFSYPNVEAAILRNVSELDFSALLRDDAEKARMETVERRVADLHERHEGVNRKLETLFGQLEQFEDETAVRLARKRIGQRATELATIEAELEAARTDLEAVRRDAANHARGPATVERLMQELAAAEGEVRHLLRLKLAAALKTVIADIRFDGNTQSIDVKLHRYPKSYRLRRGELLWQEVIARIGYATHEEVEEWMAEYQAEFNEPHEAKIIEEHDKGVIMRVRDKDGAEPFALMAMFALHHFKEPEGWKAKRARKKRA